MAGIPGRHHAVKEINAPCNAFNNVGRCSNAHQVSGLICRHIWLHCFNDAVHLLCSLPYRQTADGIAGKVQIRNALHMVHTNIGIGAALIDAPKHLLGVHRVRQAVEPCILRLAADQPAVGPVYAFLNIIPGCGILNTLVEGHADVTSQVGLNPHTLLRPHKDLMAVNMGGKVHPLLLDLPQGCQAEHLKSARVRKDGAVPGHEFVQSPHLTYNLVRWPQVQMIGIAQLHLAADVFQVLRAEGALDGPLGAHIHKHRGLHRTMGTGEFPPPGFALCFL